MCLRSWRHQAAISIGCPATAMAATGVQEARPNSSRKEVPRPRAKKRVPLVPQAVVLVLNSSAGESLSPCKDRPM